MTFLIENSGRRPTGNFPPIDEKKYFNFIFFWDRPAIFGWQLPEMLYYAVMNILFYIKLHKNHYYTLYTLYNIFQKTRHKISTGESQNEHASLSPIQEETLPQQQVI